MKKIQRKTMAKNITLVLVLILLTLSGCTTILDSLFNDALIPEEGTLNLKGLSSEVVVRRNDFGIPMITAGNLDDLIFAQGFVSAADRLTQMAGFRLAAQGRLSEMAGEAAFDMDLFLRSMNMMHAAQILYDSASDELRHLLQVYSNGVNAYLDLYRHRLPKSLTMSGYRPEKWQPVDSAAVFVLTTLGLAGNLHEEIDILNLINVLGAEKTALLIPIYPDESLPFREFSKLNRIDFSGTATDLAQLFTTIRRINDLGFSSPAASNNWAVSGKLTPSGKPLLANDTHLPLAMPSTWNIMHLKCPEVEGAGINLAGIPGIIAGYNGHIAFGMTMVMADNQDIFLERLKKEKDGLYYLYQDKWYKTRTRTETFNIKGADAITRTIHETRHGVLINNILTDPSRHDLVPFPVKDMPFGIAVKWAAFSEDRSMDAFFQLMKATTVEEAVPFARQIRAIPLNLVIADENDIAWQVTGRYPIRKNGRGLCPSPGWTGEYDWQGFIDPARHPFAQNPASGFIATANHRIIGEKSPLVLSSSWYYPDRAARIYQLIQEKGAKYDFEDAKSMQQDVQAPFMSYIKEVILYDPTVMEAVNAWPDKAKPARVTGAVRALKQFNGEMTIESPGAALCSAFLYCLPENLFADELGGTGTIAWQSLLDLFPRGYSALHDHLFPRNARSPFWDDINSPEREARSDILAETIHDAVLFLEKECGADPAGWRWGDLHTYHWQTEGTRLADRMGWFNRKILKRLAPYFDRGPYPAPGDHNTLNVAGYHPGRDFNAWLVPAMRMIVDFSREEPLYAINSSGQSDNPASAHYDDGITAWLKGEYMHMPFKQAAVEKAYPKKLMLLPE